MLSCRNKHLHCECRSISTSPLSEHWTFLQPPSVFIPKAAPQQVQTTQPHSVQGGAWTCPTSINVSSLLSLCLKRGCSARRSSQIQTNNKLIKVIFIGSHLLDVYDSFSSTSCCSTSFNTFTELMDFTQVAFLFCCHWNVHRYCGNVGLCRGRFSFFTGNGAVCLWCKM